MENFRSLYKANPINPKKCKRKEVYEIRAHKRRELYTSTRNISPSPSSKSHRSPKADQKENLGPLESEKLPGRKSPSSKMNEKLTRQKAHILKFLTWKTEKAKEAQIKEKSRRAPFVVSTRNCAATGPEITCNIKKPLVAAANPICRSPGSIQTLELKVIDSNSVRLINGIREETYHFLATPKKKTNKLQSEISAVKSYKNLYPVRKPMIGKVISDTTSTSSKRVPKIQSNSTAMKENAEGLHELGQKQKANSVLLHPKSTLPPLKRAKFKPPKKTKSSPLNAVNETTTLQERALTVKLNGTLFQKNLAESKMISEQISQTLMDANQNVVPSNTNKQSELSKKSTNGSVFVKKNAHPVYELKTHSTVVDTKPMSVPRMTMPQPFSNKSHIETTKLTKMPLNSKQNLESKNNFKKIAVKPKANTVLLDSKSVLPPIKRSTFKAPKKNYSSISNAFMAVNGITRFPRGLPTDKLNSKSVIKTCMKVETQSKKIPENLTDANEGYPYLNVVTSTRRKSLSSKESTVSSLLVEMDQLVSPVDDLMTRQVDQKFNFLRYSVVQSDATKSENESSHKITDEVVTPDKAVAPQTPTTYLSPYVSVSRGKVGIKIEKQKRNSVYMSVDKYVTDDVETATKTRHTMATVNYYRKQLNDEINRLNKQCDVWQQYKEANVDLLEDTGSDMINVTIGQTKLLTTKKFKQFGDLINRCEDRTMGKILLGKGDKAKPILPEDLEGFWAMVGLQIENVDKRFANLQRWKQNDWKDPAEIPQKPTNSNSNLKKIKKIMPGITAGPNRDLQKILKNAQAALMRKKTANSRFDEDVILTPSKNRQVLIRDRRSRSAAATVIKVNTPKVSRTSSVFEKTKPTEATPDTKVLPHIHGFRKSMKVFKSTLLNKQENKSPAVINSITPLHPLRKSILKTPGSICRPKSVIFNSPTLQFNVEEKVIKKTPPQIMSPSIENQEKERTYSLRNRNVKLRDPADIILPE